MRTLNRSTVSADIATMRAQANAYRVEILSRIHNDPIEFPWLTTEELRVDYEFIIFNADMAEMTAQENERT